MKTMRDLVIDAVLLVLYLIAANPARTGLPVHEWVSVSALLVMPVHAIPRWDRVIEMTRRFSSSIVATSTANLMIDAAALVALLTLMISGLGMSRHVLLVLGYVSLGYFFLKPVHAIRLLSFSRL